MSDRLTKDTIGQALRLLDGFVREENAAPVDLVVCGGSSLIAAGLGLGVLLAMTRRRPQHETIDEILGAGAVR